MAQKKTETYNFYDPFGSRIRKIILKRIENINLAILIGKLCISKFKNGKQTFLEEHFELINYIGNYQSSIYAKHTWKPW